VEVGEFPVVECRPQDSSVSAANVFCIAGFIKAQKEAFLGLIRWFDSVNSRWVLVECPA